MIKNRAALASVVLERIPALPKVCTPPTANTPLGNFDVFAQTFAEQYISFDGENTQGVFCDLVDRHLPNGWTFVLPNAVYRTSDGRAFNVSGIPSDLAVPVFADQDVAPKHHPAMATALRLLATK